MSSDYLIVQNDPKLHFRYMPINNPESYSCIQVMMSHALHYHY